MRKSQWVGLTLQSSRGSALIHFTYGHLFEVGVVRRWEIKVHFNYKQKSKTTLKAPIDLAQGFSNLSMPQISGGLEKTCMAGSLPRVADSAFRTGVGILYF